MSRYRTQKSSSADYTSQTRLYGSVVSSDHHSFISSQQTWDEVHAWRNTGGGNFDVGGPFDSLRHDYTDSHQILKLSSKTGGGDEFYGYTGPQFAAYAQADSTTSLAPWPDVPQTDDLRLWSLGGTAISRCKPTSHVASAAVFLGELKRDGLPEMFGSNLLKKQTRRAKFGSEYLNWEFGWKPLMSDLRSFAKVVRDSHEIVNTAQRNSGKVVRRRYAFPAEQSTEVTEGSGAGYGPVPTLNPYLADYTGCKRRRVLTTRREVWFSGAFTYYLDTDSSALGQLHRHAQLADKLLGLAPTPDNVWNLAPWSWAADWFANTGDILSNMSDMVTQGLVMHHGYIMEKITSSAEWTTTGAVYCDGSRPTFSQTFTTVRKTRRHASPFGFGLNYSDFTPKQLAIMTALGMTAKGSKNYAK